MKDLLNFLTSLPFLYLIFLLILNIQQGGISLFKGILSIIGIIIVFELIKND